MRAISKLKFHPLVFGAIALILVVCVACGGDDGGDTVVSPATSTAPTATSPAPSATKGPEPTVRVLQSEPTPSPTATAVPRTDSTQVPTSEARELSDAELLNQSASALANKYGEEPRQGGIFLANNWEPVPHYDSQQILIGGTYVTTALAYDGLVSQGPYDPLAQVIVPDLAHSWEITEGGAKVVFHLENGVKWHDGQPFSSDDVIYTFDRVMNPPELVVSHRGPIFNALIDKFEALDPDTIVVHGKGPSGLLLPLFANGWSHIVARHFVEPDPVGALKTAVMGTGAFKLIEEPTSTLWRYERNPDYFMDGLPFLDGIEYHIIQDAQAQAAALLTERIYFNDVIGGINWDADLANSTLEREPRLVYTPTTWQAIYYLSLNAQNPPFDDLRVRQAISEAIDRKQIAELGPGDGAVGTAAYPFGQWVMPKERQEQLIGYGPNMEERISHAKELLADYEAENGEIDWSTLKIQCSSNISWSCANGVVIQQLLKEIDVNMDLDPMDVTQHRGGEIAGDFDISTLGASLVFDDPIDVYGQFFITEGGRWFQQSSIPELDVLYEKQKFTADVEERKQLVWDMDTLAMNDAAWDILLWWNLNGMRWDYVKGFTFTAFFSNTNARMKHVWLSCDAPTANC